MSDKPSARSKTPYVPRDNRAEAELQLAKHPQADLARAATVEKMLHALQVHQIELEMQNEQLRQAHIALAESRDRYLDLFEFAPIGYFTLDANNLIAEVNFVGAALLGEDRKKLLLTPFSKYIVAEDCDQFYLCMSRLSRDEVQQNYDLQIKRDDASTRHVHLDAMCVKKNDGSVTFRITLTDISKSKRIEAALKESEQRLNFAFKGSGDGMWDWDASTGQVNFSKQWKSMLGYHDEELENEFKEWETRVHPEDLSQSLADINDYLEGKVPTYSNQHRLLCKDGSYKWILSRGIIVSRNADGKPARLIGTHTDITEQKDIEQNLRISATAFEVQEGIIVTDANNIIIRVNAAFTWLTGYSAAEAVGKNASLISSRLHNASFFKNMFNAVNSERYWQGELWNQRKSCEVFPCLMTITAVLDNQGHVSNYVGSFSDITLQKQAKTILMEAKKQLEIKLEKNALELSTFKNESDELNTALKVMIKMRNSENLEAKSLLNEELNHEVLPFLQRLKSGNQDAKQIHLVHTLEANLQRLVTSYGSPTSITSSYKNFTPKEIQVATMVREGFSTKAIASTLSLSPETISIHRKNIRKKLGLGSKGENLRSYLITFEK